MILNSYISFLKILLRLGKWTGLTPVVYNDSEQKLLFSSSKSKLLAFRVSLVVTTLYSFVMVLRLATKSYEFARTMVGCGYIVIIGGEAALRWNWSLDEKYINYINAMILWEKKHVPGNS